MQARAAAATPQPQPPQPPPVTGKRKRGKEAAAMMGMMDTFTVRSSLLPTASTSSSSTLPSTFPLPRPTPVVIGPASLSSPTPLRLNISSQTPAATVIPPNSMPRPPAQQVRRADEPADIELSTDDLIPRSPVASNIYKSHADGPPRSTGFVYDQPESVFPDPFFLAAGRVSPPRATIEEIETDDTLAPPLGEDTPQPKTRSLTPLFLDDRSPTRDGAQPFGIAIGDEAATSEDDVDAILHGSMRSDSPEIQVLDGPPAVPRVRRAPHTVQPEAGSSRAASRLSDPPRLPNSGPVRPVCHSWSYPKPDRVVVLVPVIRRPMIKPKTTSYVQFADFPTRGVLCKCEWNNCRAVLDCEDRLSLHMRKIHGQELPVSGRCEWKGCMQPFGRSVQFREHLESAHARNCLRCAYRDCSFQTSSGHLGALAEHVASTHATLGQQQLAAVVKPQLPLAPSPTLPLDRESVPPWRIGTVLVRPHVMTPARRNQLGNWVLAQSFARTDVDEVLPKKNSQARPRKDGSRDLSDVTVPLLSGIELELKQQYNWAEFEQTRKPRGIPASIQVGRVLEIA
ncbi:hypothetical protein BKA62DRAFT_84044 [Auriculariales sp. MPI-PUGE-AT-0066]|nr:hypothetical protein BKA62DRAFT_84044 [Auriculariales sp. MPI-PUGE-AT-0066]